LYRQNNRMLLHLVNLTTVGGSRGPIDAVIPIGPIKVTLSVPPGSDWRNIRLRVGPEKGISVNFGHGKVEVMLPRLREHELIVFG
jgi:hypothetical protein